MKTIIINPNITDPFNQVAYLFKTYARYMEWVNNIYVPDEPIEGIGIMVPLTVPYPTIYQISGTDYHQMYDMECAWVEHQTPKIYAKKNYQYTVWAVLHRVYLTHIIHP
jgi:hypothetical protein